MGAKNRKDNRLNGDIGAKGWPPLGGWLYRLGDRITVERTSGGGAFRRISKPRFVPPMAASDNPQLCKKRTNVHWHRESPTISHELLSLLDSSDSRHDRSARIVSGRTGVGSASGVAVFARALTISAPVPAARSSVSTHPRRSRSTTWPSPAFPRQFSLRRPREHPMPRYEAFGFIVKALDTDYEAMRRQIESTPRKPVDSENATVNQSAQSRLKFAVNGD